MLAVSDFTRREIAALLPGRAPRAWSTSRTAPTTTCRRRPPREEARARGSGVRGPAAPDRGRRSSTAAACPCCCARWRRLLRAPGPDLALEVVGENRTHPAARPGRAGRRALGLARHVRLLRLRERGRRSPTATPRRTSAVFLSEYEGFGLPALEAMARGVPVVASDRPRSARSSATAALLVDPRDDAGGRGRRSTRVLARRRRCAPTWSRAAAPSRRATPGRRPRALTREALAAAARDGHERRRRASRVVVVSYNTRERPAALPGLARASTCALPLEVDRGGQRQRGRLGRRRCAPRFPAARWSRTRENVGLRRAPATAACARRARPTSCSSTATPRCGRAPWRRWRRVLDAQPEVGIVGPRTRRRATARIAGLLRPAAHARCASGGSAGWCAACARARAGGARARPRPWPRASTSRPGSPAPACWPAASARRPSGGFDEGFFLYEEDVDLCLRVRAAGWRVLFTPAAEVVHHLGAQHGPGAATARALEYHRSHLRYYRKHNGLAPPLLLRVLPAARCRGGLGSGPGAAPAARGREDSRPAARLTICAWRLCRGTLRLGTERLRRAGGLACYRMPRTGTPDIVVKGPGLA